MLELIKAASRFDPARRPTFGHYASPCIMGGLKKHFRDTGWKLRVNGRKQELYLLTSNAMSVLAQRLGHTPTIGELAAHLHLSENDTSEGLNSHLAYMTFSLSRPLLLSRPRSTPTTRSSAISSVAATSTSKRHPTGKHLPRTSHLLPAREQRILRLRFFDDLTQHEIAE